MEIKKTEKASLENKRLIFAEVGLIAALLVVYAGFESSTRACSKAAKRTDSRKRSGLFPPPRSGSRDASGTTP